MRIASKYLIREFLKPFLLSILVFTFISLITEIFEDMPILTEKVPAILTVAEYYFLEAPYKTAQIMPVAVLLGVLFSLSRMVKNNEITAFKASGLNILRLSLPLLSAIAVLSILVFAWNEFVVPGANRKARNIWQTKVKNVAIKGGIIKNNFAFTTVNGWWIYAKEFDGENGIMKNAIGINLDQNQKITQRFDAAEVRWTGQQSWVANDVYWRLMENSGEDTAVKSSFYQAKLMDLGNNPQDFGQKNLREIKQLNIFELANLVKKLKQMGAEYREELVNLHLRISFPLANFILAVLGISFALRTFKSEMIVSFALSIVVGFFYWGMIAIGIALGKNGVIGPFMSAWLGNFIFGILGLWLLKNAT